MTMDMLARSCPAGVPHSQPEPGCDLIVGMVLNVMAVGGGGGR